MLPDPPQTTILVPAHTAVWRYRASGTLVVLVAVQLFAVGSYRPPVLRGWPVLPLYPPHTTILLPVQTAVCRYRVSGALVVLVAVQPSVAGSYRPPVFE